jgi:NAD(P)-dependent dehydrogenase (short-subunit alcohol dehydrogenase family)/acyl dehydratase
MGLNFDAIGRKFGPVTQEYDWQKVVLYALGVGAGFDDLDYCYEKNLKVIPSFSIATIIDCMTEIGLESGIDPSGLLHGEQDLIFHNEFPVEGTLSTEAEITNYYDKGEGKGALVIAKSETYHSDGKKLFTAISTLFARKDGGFGGENAPKNEIKIPDRDPDIVVDERPSRNQPLLYRLSGDTFALHADPEFAKMAGFEMPIMHGLCTHGYACRTLINNLIPGEPEKARRMYCRFARTLYPGEPIRIQIWKEEEGKAFWRVINANTGDTVIDRGVFEYGEIPKEEIRFDDKVAIVTGAGRGLGREYALELARRGAKVVVNDYGGTPNGAGDGSKSPADVVVQEINEMGGEAVANYANIADPEGGESVVQTGLEAFGTVDILINNAGILRDKSLVKLEEKDWKAVLDVHLHGSYHVTRPAFQVMKEKGYGRILFTASGSGLYGNFGQTNYSAAKVGLVGLMNSLKIEGKKYNIHVNTISPGAASRLTQDLMPADMLEKADPKHVTPLAVYLCSDRCTVTGNIYNAMMGFFNRVAICTGPGTAVRKGDKPATVEELIVNLDKISTLEGAIECEDANAQLGVVFSHM